MVGDPSRLMQRLPIIVHAVAVLAGIALIGGFARFNMLHEEFLAANFDAVHSARTLLKARYFLGQAEQQLARAGESGAGRSTHLTHAVESLTIAESYGSEGADSEPAIRHALAQRIASVRRLLAGADGGMPDSLIAEAAGTVHRLSADFEAAELDRWGTLSSLNAELVRRMHEMRLFIAGIATGFVILMLTLGWALRHARDSAAQLRRARDQLQAIQQTTLDAAGVGIAYVDAREAANRRVTAANRQMGEIFGYAAAELVGLHTATLFPDEAGHRELTQRMLPGLARGEVLRTEMPMRRRTGEIFWCAISGKAVDPRDLGRGLVWTFEDISERKAAEAALREARARAEEANRAKSEFLANMSHEIRTPFTGILGVLELLEQSDLSDAQRGHIRLAHDSANQLLGIVNDILDLSRIEAGKLVIRPENIDLRRLLEDLAQVHGAAAAHKGLRFTAAGLGEVPPRVAADPVRLRQIIDNLLSNAVKFTAHGEVALDVRWRERDGRLRVEVSDSGIGIAPEQRERIFDKFTQADSSTTRLYGGSGLGLTICRQLVHMMGGEIGLDSSPGEGSRFWFEMPLSVAANAAVEDAPPVAPAAMRDLRELRVLLVDDVEISREVIGLHLRNAGCAVQGARSGEEAVRLAAEGTPDLILMDCQMPGMDGYEATRRIRAHEGDARHTPIIALTAHAMKGDRDKCLAAGMDDYLSKPVARKTLLAKLAEWAHTARRAGSAGALPAAARSGFSGRILLVDDDPSIREASRGLLESLGCEVVLAANGAEALAAGERDADLDLVLMDCRMPGMDGWTAAARWRERERALGRPPTAIVALTAGERDDSLALCREAGMDDFLGKPFSPAQLRDLLARWLG